MSRKTAMAALPRSGLELAPGKSRPALDDYPEIMNPADVIEYTGLARGTVYAWLRQPDGPAVRIRSRLVVPRERLRRFLDSGGSEPHEDGQR